MAESKPEVKPPTDRAEKTAQETLNQGEPSHAKPKPPPSK